MHPTGKAILEAGAFRGGIMGTATSSLATVGKAGTSLLLIASLSACGGGGVSSSGTNATTVTRTWASQVTPPAGYVVTPMAMQGQRSAQDDAEYRARYYDNEYVNALYALDSGYTGAGVTIGVVDDGIDTSNPEFAGRISSLSRDFGYNIDANGMGTARNVLGDSNSDHGTAVSSIIAANRNGVGMEGLAYNAQLAMLRISNNDNGTEYISEANLIDALNYAAANGIKVVSASLASEQAATDYQAAVTSYGATGNLLINAAGNYSEASPRDTLNVTAANRSTWLFVGALVTNGTSYTLASYSNAAGAMADRYVVAPADGAVVTYGGNGATGSASGTSMATPMVSALAADILGKWPQLTGQQAGGIILATAKDIGDPGIDAIFGHGLIDFKAALSPVNPTISNGATTQSLATAATTMSSAIDTGALSQSLANVTVLDAFGRDFTGSVGALVHPEKAQTSTAAAVSHMARRKTNGFALTRENGLALVGIAGYSTYENRDQANVQRASLDYADVSGSYGDLGFHYGFNAQRSAVDATGLGLGVTSDAVSAYAPQTRTTFGVDLPSPGGRLGFSAMSGATAGAGSAAAIAVDLNGKTGSLRLGVIEEKGAVFGVRSTGALAIGRGASTLFLEGAKSFGISGGWSLKGYGSLGLTHLARDPSSVITGTSALLSTRLGLTAEHQLFGGLLGLGVAQPLNVEAGSAQLHLPTGYDLASERLTYSERRASLAGKRKLEVSAGYTREWNSGSFRLGLVHDAADGTSRGVISLAESF